MKHPAFFAHDTLALTLADVAILQGGQRPPALYCAAACKLERRVAARVLGLYALGVANNEMPFEILRDLQSRLTQFRVDSLADADKAPDILELRKFLATWRHRVIVCLSSAQLLTD